MNNDPRTVLDGGAKLLVIKVLSEKYGVPPEHLIWMDDPDKMEEYAKRYAEISIDIPWNWLIVAFAVFMGVMILGG